MSLENTLEQIEKGLNNMPTNADMAEMRDRLLQLEQRGGLRQEGGLTPNGQTAGDQFLKQFEASKDLFSKTKSLRLEVKAAADMIGTSNARTLISGGVGAQGMNAIGFQYALPTRGTPGVSAVEYSRMTSTEGNAGVQAGEGALKDAVRPVHTLITQSAMTVAGWTKVSSQALNDSAELKAAIDLTLARSVGAALNAALANGGTGFTGGFNALATASTSAVYPRLADAISEAVADMQIAGFNPDRIVMSPGTWLLLTTAQDSAGAYLGGDALYLGGTNLQLRGLPVVLSTGITAGSAMVMDSTHSELLVNQDFTIELGFTGNDFTSNMVVVRGELRVIPIFRTTSSMWLITPKPAV